jgi:drug/metabolite transporter (DMT)-like permease
MVQYGRPMPLSALLLVLAAAFLHALWNMLLARAHDSEAATAVVLVVAFVAYAPVAALVWRADASVWPYVLGSGLLHLVYFGLLAAAYHRAELSVVYPLARGTAPVLVLLAGVVVLGAGSSAVQAAGVCLVGAGVVLVRGLRRPAAGSGVGFGLAIAVVIAAYTMNDNSGVEHANPITYLELSMILPTIAYTAAVGSLKGLPALRAELNVAAVIAGLGTFGAYALVLEALARAPAAPVAAARETSVVIAAVLARAFLKEPVTATRFAGAALVAGGVALVSL